MTKKTMLAASAAMLATCVLCMPARAADDETKEGTGTAGEAPKNAPSSTPITAFTYSTGAPKGTVGAMGYGAGTTATGGSGFAGGGTVWGSPIDRLTVVADAQRDVTAQFAPSVAALVRILGNGARGWSLAALVKYKVDGFARGPNKEFESEAETGAVVGYHRDRFHFDFNAIGGMGLTEDREVDSEARLRVGYDLTSFLRFGIDEQARYRISGATKLPGGRNGDFGGGAQLLVSWKNFFGALTGGPTTIGVVDKNVGWMAMVTVGGVTL